MKMKGNKIFVKILENSDAEALLRLELRNRDFFQTYTPLRDDDFYTLEGQLDRIRKYSEMKNLDQLYSFGIFLMETGELIGKVRFQKWYEDICKVAGSDIV